jgi:hypothetical protein
VWASDSIKLVSAPKSCWIRVTIMDLATGKAEQHGYGNSNWEWRNRGRCNLRDPGTAQFMRSKSGGLLLLRYLAPDESYWW